MLVRPQHSTRACREVGDGDRSRKVHIPTETIGDRQTGLNSPGVLAKNAEILEEECRAARRQYLRKEQISGFRGRHIREEGSLLVHIGITKRRQATKVDSKPK